MQPAVIVDTGPIVALLDADETHHRWAHQQFKSLAPPLLTSESVLSDLIRRYANVPMSLADACLVLILERTENGSIMTLDSDFQVYRQGRRRTIRVLSPQT